MVGFDPMVGSAVPAMVAANSPTYLPKADGFSSSFSAGPLGLESSRFYDSPPEWEYARRQGRAPSMQRNLVRNSW